MEKVMTDRKLKTSEMEEESPNDEVQQRRVLTPEDIQGIRENREVMQRRISNPDHKKLFRNAYCFKVGYDFSSLKPYCENLIQVTDGWSDHIDKTREKIEQGLAEYDSNKDLLVLAGRVIDHLLVGQIVTQKVLAKPKAYQSYAVAMYLNPSYIFYEIFIDPTIPSQEIDSK